MYIPKGQIKTPMKILTQWKFTPGVHLDWKLSDSKINLGIRLNLEKRGKRKDSMATLAMPSSVCSVCRVFMTVLARIGCMMRKVYTTKLLPITPFFDASQKGGKMRVWIPRVGGAMN